MKDQILDIYLPGKIRDWFEANYYSRVNAQARLEVIYKDVTLWEGPDHVAWYSDHGVVHVRDVARQVLTVLDVIPGVLIPTRPQRRVEVFMKSYGVMLAYLHDIGMVDFTTFGRAIHPEFASQAIFSPEFDPFIDEIWSENYGNIAWRLLRLDRDQQLEQSPKVVLREMLSLSVAHSKSKVPATIMANPVALRKTMQIIQAADLAKMNQHKYDAAGPGFIPKKIISQQRLDMLRRYYRDFQQEGYAWLVSPRPAVRELVQDVIDTLRALRCADALRQRGTVLRTSGGYEVFVSQQTGNPLYALRLGEEKLYLLEVNNLLSGGEANIASSELTSQGDLRISFHRGEYANYAGLQRAIQAAVATIMDLKSDIIESFVYPARISNSGNHPEKKIQILLESTEDNPQFVDLVIQELQLVSPDTAACTLKVPCLQAATNLERTRYLQAAELDWSLERRANLFQRIATCGQKIDGIDLIQAYQFVKEIHLKAGEVLIEAGEPSGLVYLPLDEGLYVIPLGGYQPFMAPAWMPLGTTGVIRGAARNARVIANQDLSLLVIPKEVYLQQWYRPYNLEELRKELSSGLDPKP
jgi:hypothetical protein